MTPSPHPPRSRRWVVVGVGVLLAAAAGFAALAAWQVERRIGKLALMDRVAQRLAAPAQGLPPPASWSALDPQAQAYLKVRVTGRWLPAADTLVQATTALGPGWWLMTPLRTDDGGVVLVNRGYVPSSWKREGALGPADRPGAAVEHTVTVTGLLRPSEPGGGFLRANDPGAGRWTSRDVAAIASAHRLGPVAAFFIDADRLPGVSAESVGRQPVGGLTVVQFRNHHAVYALTWSMLALMCVAAAGWLIREHRRAVAS